jgi:hypothetical protein
MAENAAVADVLRRRALEENARSACAFDLDP